jgi:hypothetical protein
MTRDENGRFVKGHEPMGGRPPRAKEEQYYRILTTAVTQADWKAIIEKAVQQAIKGDAVARKWLADYLVGAPIQRSEVSGFDGENLKIEVIYKKADSIE